MSLYRHVAHKVLAGTARAGPCTAYPARREGRDPGHRDARCGSAWAAGSVSYSVTREAVAARSGLPWPCLGEGPSVSLQILGGVGAEAGLGYATDDGGARRCGTGVVGVEVVNEYPGLVPWRW